jgi:glycosyltransferase involved in cell wall biosynthesis
MMQVTLFRDLPEERKYSMERYASALARALGALDGAAVQVRQVCLSAPARQRHPGRGALRRAGALARRYVQYPLYARAQQGQLNHVVDHGYGDLVWFLDAKRTLVTCHDLMLLREDLQEEAGYPRGARLRFRRWCLPGMLRAARIIADSEATRQHLAQATGYPAERIRVVPLGIEPHFRPVEDAARLEAVRRRYSLPPKPLVLHAGSSEFYKNVEGVLRTVAELRRSGLGVHLVKVGAGLTRAQQALARSLGLADALTCTGEVSEADLVALYTLANVLLFPSLHEGFGLPVLEAMACGTPVVCSRAPALVEVAGDAALMAEAQVSRGLAQQVARVLLDGRLRDELVRRGRARAAQFTWERTARLTLQVYEEVLAAMAQPVPQREQARGPAWPGWLRALARSAGGWR